MVEFPRLVPAPQLLDRACIDCQREGVPYRVETHGKKSLIYLRCLKCGLEWTVERASATAIHGKEYHPNTPSGKPNS